MSGPVDVDGATVQLRTIASIDMPCTTVQPLPIGRVLRDRYVIRRQLGSGGRGMVFEALDRYRSSLPESEQYVALKILHAGRDCPAEAISDLRRELHFGQVLSHPNIVNVYELDRDQDVVFFTMELLDGELLSEVIKRMQPAALKRSQAMHIVRQLGAALSHAHERGVIHGDLKPRNVLITREGQVRLLDFGAARTSAPPQSAQRAPVSGTPAYASCEMLEGRASDACDDVYALACICYELLSGAHPFALRKATVARDFGVVAARPNGLTSRQWRILQKGLSWHRAGRSMGVRAFVHELTHQTTEAVATPLQALAPAISMRPRWQSRVAALSVITLVVCTALIGGLGAISPENKNSVAPTKANPDVQTQIVSTPSSAASTPPMDETMMAAPPANAKAIVSGMTHVKSTSVRSNSAIAVDGYHVSTGERFVEIRVHRDRLHSGASFTWWTEPATAKQDIDYVHQAKAIQSFSPAQRSTRFYVKLLPDSGRSQRDYFYVAIAPVGRVHDAESVKRLQIWLPTARDRMQASR